MRCKSCKKKIENENLFRCPHCGKPIEKKKKKDPKELMSIIPFFAVGAVFVVLNFFGLFFKCDYYTPAAIIISIVLFFVLIPFVFGNYKGMNRAVADWFGVVLSVPFIVNWAMSFIPNSSTLAFDTLGTMYCFSVPAVLIINDVILILKSSGIIGSGKTVKWICLGLGIAEFAFTIVFYSITKDIKVLAMLVLAINALLPAYSAFHIISRDDREQLTAE